MLRYAIRFTWKIADSLRESHKPSVFAILFLIMMIKYKVCKGKKWFEEGRECQYHKVHSSNFFQQHLIW